MNKRDIVIGFIILAVVAGIIYFVRRPKVTPIVTPTPSVEEQIESKFKTVIPEDTERAELRDTTGGTSSGIAARKFENEKFTLTVLADLPDPTSSEFYEVWLVRGKTGETNYAIIALGSMQIAKGGYLLDYNINKDYSDYQQVVVSQETKLTNFPQKTILEGSF